MNKRLLITTAVGLILGTSAFAQSQNETSRTVPIPSATQNRMNSESPSSSTSSSPSAQSGSTSNPSAETQAPRSSTTTSQSSPSNATGNNPPASRVESDKNAGSSNSQRTDSNSTQSNSRAQSSAPGNSPNQAQGNAPASSSNQAQQAPAGGANANRTAEQPNNANSNTTAQQPDNRTNTAQSPSSSVNASVHINDRERIRVSQSIDRLNVRPLNNVNFSLSVGTVVPRDIHFQPLPADVVEIVPQYRGYDFFMVRDEIAIVEPSTYKIVDVIPRSGGSTASAPASSQRKVTFSDSDREVIRKHARVRTESRTTGSTTSTRVRVGDRLPDSVEIQSFSDDDYRDSPILREYRYIQHDNRTYVVEPQERRIIEEID